MKSIANENRIVCTDCLDGMARLSSDSIPLTVTSPPYDDLRTYGGHSAFDFHAVARELYRVTMSGGVVVWVVQEQVIDGSESGETSRQRLAFADIGFRLHHTMVMAKSGGHQHSTNRYGRPLEYAFILSKGAPRYFCPLRDKPNREAGRVKTFKNRLPDGSFAPAKRRMTPPFGIRPPVWTYPTGRNVTAKEGFLVVGSVENDSDTGPIRLLDDPQAVRVAGRHEDPDEKRALVKLRHGRPPIQADLLSPGPYP